MGFGGRHNPRPRDAQGYREHVSATWDGHRMTTSTPYPILQLVLAAATGVWAVRSESQTAYDIDASAGRLIRVPGAGSSGGPFDGVWVELVELDHDGQHPDGVIAAGSRHRWQTDPQGASQPYRWWLQGRCVAIDPVPVAQVPEGREPDPDESWKVYGRPGG